jgi:hypothetical protein
MAEVNLINVATIVPSNIGFNLTNATNSKLITPATDKVIKINTITVANVDETNDATIDLYVDGMGTGGPGTTSTGTGYLTADATVYIAKGVNVPAGSTLVLLSSPIYLMEADILSGGTDNASDLDLFISYEVLDDA